MKLRLISDFHGEFYNENFMKMMRILDEMICPPLPDDKNTVLILAGDICTAKRGYMLKAIVTHLAERFRHVIYVPGNHEYYQGDIIEANAKIEEELKDIKNISFGVGTATLDDKTFVFATLWTDFAGESPRVLAAAHMGMNDYRIISHGHGLLVPDTVLELHKRQLAYIAGNVKPGCIVITHHAPSWQSIHPKYIGNPLNGCYASNLDDFIIDAKIALWCHGHVHHHFDYKVGDARIVCNPVGYVGEVGDIRYDPKFVVEV